MHYYFLFHQHLSSLLQGKVVVFSFVGANVKTRDVTHTKLQSQNKFKESTWGGSSWGVRMDVNEELKFL